MRITAFALLFVCCWSISLSAQAVSDQDTTIYTVLEEMPRFPGCENIDTTLTAKAQCAQQQLLAFVYQNVVYPMAARMNGNEGTAVVSFIVEKDGAVTDPKIVRNLEGGCGEEALRVVRLMEEYEIKWTPGRKDGKPVRTRFNLPVRFRLEELPPYVVSGRDTIYTSFETPLEFEGGTEGLKAHMDKRLDYPPSGNDSCLIGTIEVQILVRKNGDVRILNMTDYNDLGFDFWYEAIDAATSTLGKWKLATYEGRQVTSTYDISMSFVPTDEGCRQRIDNYQKAYQLASEGQQLIADEQADAGLEKLSQALALFPDDAQLLLARGQAYLDLSRFAEACADLSKARRIALVNDYDNVLPIICK
jgi:TonB family protein